MNQPDLSSPVPAPDSNSSTTRGEPRTVNDKNHTPASSPLVTKEDVWAFGELVRFCKEKSVGYGGWYEEDAVALRSAEKFLARLQTFALELAVDPSRSTPEEVDPAVSEVSRLRSQVERMRAIHELIADDILICCRDGGFLTSDDDKSTLHYSVFCSDTFAFACADMEAITPDEAVVLHRIMRERPEGIAQHHIATAWVAWKRGLTRKDVLKPAPPEEAFEYFRRRLSSDSRDSE